MNCINLFTFLIKHFTKILCQNLQYSNIDEEAFTIYRIDPSLKQLEEDEESEETDEEQPKSSRRKYICPSCNAKITATKDVNVICGDCEVAFEKVE